MQPLIQRLLDLAVRIQQIPAPTFHEHERARFLHAQFQQLALQDVSTDPVGNVYARLPGQGDTPPIVISAHSDTVFPRDTDLSVARTPGKIHGPGIGDNSLAVAALPGLVWALRARNATLPGDLWLVANTGEEGLGDLRGMRAVVERFGSAPLAYIVLEGMALGRIYHRGVAVRRYRITAQTHGGHSWVHFGRPSAIHTLAELIVQITALPLPAEPRTTLNVGVIHGGTSVNTIAPQASCELDLRSEDSATLQNLLTQLKTLIARFNHNAEITIQTEKIGDRPAGGIPARHPLVRLAQRCLQQQGLEPHLSISSTDANIPLSQGLPAICIGLTTGGDAHTVREYIYTDPLHKGMAQLLTLIERAFDEL